MAEAQRPARLSGGQRAAVGVSVTLGLGLAAYGVAGSYQTVSGMAERRGVPLALLVPVGIDGGLIGVVVLDLSRGLDHAVPADFLSERRPQLLGSGLAVWVGRQWSPH